MRQRAGAFGRLSSAVLAMEPKRAISAMTFVVVAFVVRGSSVFGDLAGRHNFPKKQFNRCVYTHMQQLLT